MTWHFRLAFVVIVIACGTRAMARVDASHHAVNRSEVAEPPR